MSPVRMIGNYVLGPLLGRGGMSEVYAATHRFLGDRVAIKLLRSHLAADPDATAAFVAEATRTREIDHPGVVRVLDFGSDGQDFYLVMERLDGETLAARLRRVGRLDEPEVCRIGAAVAEAVAAAHDRGIVHRDLTPGNIMLGPEPTSPPKIVDFGIARCVHHDGIAVTGSRIGTLAYMAPEQLIAGLVAACIDIWALGVILYEALAGHLPFDDFKDGRTPQLFDAPLRLADVAVVSPALAALVEACLHRDPGKRPSSMRAIAEALRQPTSDQRFTEELAPWGGRQDAGSDAARVANTAPVPGRRSWVVAGSFAALATLMIGTWTRYDCGAHDVAADTSPANSRPRVEPASAEATLATAPLPTAATATPTGATVPPTTASTATPTVPPTALPTTAPTALPTTAPTALPTTASTALPTTASTALPTTASTALPTTASTGSTARPPTGSTAPIPPASTRSASTTAATPRGFITTRRASAATPHLRSSPGASPATTPGSPSIAIEIRSVPTGAAIIVHDQQIGITPATLALDAPTSILVIHTGYQPFRQRVERAGTLDVQLVPQPATRDQIPASGETLD